MTHFYEMIFSFIILFIPKVLSENELVSIFYDFTGCRKSITSDADYFEFFSFDDTQLKQSNLMLDFFVRAKSNAHILLSETNSPKFDKPVYEIVLGAGENTFSGIRRLQRAETKYFADTHDLLSDNEYRGFWIHVKDGLIEVGRKDEDKSFLNWKDSKPLSIKYYSFSTWNSIIGNWYHACPKSNKSVFKDKEVEKLSPSEKLLGDLLVSYDPFVPPESSSPYLPISIHLICQRVSLNVKRSSLILQGHLSMSWMDQKIQWQPGNYSGLKKLALTHSELWSPELSFRNSVNFNSAFIRESRLVVNNEGLILWSPAIDIETFCGLDFSYWPNDIHFCKIQIGSWAQHDKVQFFLEQNGTSEMIMSDWKIINTTTRNVWIATVLNSNETILNSSVFEVALTFQRTSISYSLVFITPLIVLVLLLLSVFWTPVTSPMKVATVCLIMLILILFILALTFVVPTSSLKAPNLVKIYGEFLVITTLAMILSIFESYVSRNGMGMKLPDLLVRIIFSRSLSFLLCLPHRCSQIQTSIKYQRDNLNDVLVGNESHKNEKCGEKMENPWNRLVQGIDNFCFFIYVIMIIWHTIVLFLPY